MALIILVTEKGKKELVLSLCRYSTTGNGTMNSEDKPSKIKVRSTLSCPWFLAVYVYELSLVHKKMQEKHWFHLQNSRHNTGRPQEKGISTRLSHSKNPKLFQAGRVLTLRSSACITNSLLAQ